MITLPESQTLEEAGQMGGTDPSLRKPEVTRIVHLFRTEKDESFNGVIPTRTRTTRWTGPIEELFGFSLNDVEDAEDWWIQRIHPDDREAVRDSLDCLLVSAPEQPFAAESRISGTTIVSSMPMENTYCSLTGLS